MVPDVLYCTLFQCCWNMKVNIFVYIPMVSPFYLNASQNQLLHLCINAAIANPIITPLLQLSRGDRHSASTSLWWLFAAQQFWTAWVRHRQGCSHNWGLQNIQAPHTFPHQQMSSPCWKDGIRQKLSDCVWGCYFYTVSELQRHHPGGSECQDLNSSTWSFLMWWKPYTDPQLLLLFDSFWLVTRRALISSWTCP